MKLELKNATFNYLSRKSQSRPANCMFRAEVWESDKQKFLLVVDYYTPRRKGKHLRSGWYIALRKPGYVPRLRPQLVLFLKDGYDCPDLDTITQTINTIF